MNFTKVAYVIPNKAITNSCVEHENGLSLPPPIQLQLSKPASVTISLVITIEEQGTQSK